MDQKLKILLGETGSITQSNQDIFINVDLRRTFNEFKKEKYDNDFDLAEQFRKERNSSRNFTVYGIIDSVTTDCNDLSLSVFSESSATVSSLVKKVKSTPLVYDGKNVFGKIRGKYVVELKNYVHPFIYIRVQEKSVDKYETQVFPQQLIFSGGDGTFIEYGTNTIDVGINNKTGNIDTIEIRNDFPFFYNIHWIKQDLDIVKTKNRTISFTESSSIFDTSSENNIKISLSLSEPSVFGNEQAWVRFGPNTLQFKWKKGEQEKSFTINKSDRDVGTYTAIIESDPNNTDTPFVNLSPGLIMEHTLTII